MNTNTASDAAIDPNTGLALDASQIAALDEIADLQMDAFYDCAE